MSTLTTPPLAPDSAADRAFSPALWDNVTVRNLLTAPVATVLPRLNADLGLQLSETACRHVQDFFRDTAHRDPTVGELRLLDALDRHGQDHPTRIAVETLTTKSPFLAETWADMMRCHGEKHGVGAPFRRKKVTHAPPCTLTDALSLGSYEDIEPPTAPVRALLSAPWQEAVAATLAYTPVARFRVGTETRSLWVRRGTPRYVSPIRTGDMILYLSRAELPRLLRFLEAEAAMTPPFSGSLCAVAQKSLLLTLIELSPSVDLYADRVANTATHSGVLPVDALCAMPTIGADGVCDYLLRTPLQQVQSVMEALKRFGITVTICGRVRETGNTVILTRDPNGKNDIPVASLPASLLTAMSPVYLYPMEVSLKQDSVSPFAPRLARYPSALPGEEGVTPDHHEAVALTLHEGQILFIPEANVLTATMSSTVHRPDIAFTRAADTVIAATDLLLSANAAPQNMVLSVALTLPSDKELKDGTALAAIMGVYRVAAERDLPVEDPVITVAPTDGLLRVTVTVHAENQTDDTDAPNFPSDRQWHNSGETRHKDAPGFLLPVIRRPYEGCLNALSAALERDAAARCIIRPLVMDTREVEIPVAPETETVEATPVKEIRYTLNPTSVQELCKWMRQWFTPIFCMNEEDTRTLLAEPDVTDTLTGLIDMGYPVIVLGEACKPFAELGYLPTSLSSLRMLSEHSPTATVTYSFPTEPSTRPLRGNLLAPSDTEAQALMSIHLPDGTTVSDGFVGKGGQVLGILNGVDTTVLPLLRKHHFGI